MCIIVYIYTHFPLYEQPAITFTSPILGKLQVHPKRSLHTFPQGCSALRAGERMDLAISTANNVSKGGLIELLSLGIPVDWGW